jgi:hypothetical protein
LDTATVKPSRSKTTHRQELQREDDESNGDPLIEALMKIIDGSKW